MKRNWQSASEPVSGVDSEQSRLPFRNQRVHLPCELQKQSLADVHSARPVSWKWNKIILQKNKKVFVFRVSKVQKQCILIM